MRLRCTRGQHGAKQGGLNEQGERYLIRRKPEARGIVSIGLVALALLAGGISNTQELGLFSSSSPIIHYEHAAQRAGGSFDIEIEGVTHSVSDVASYASVAPEPAPPFYVPAGPTISLQVTHYGESFNGYGLGCGTGYYSSDNPTIIAVGPAREGEWPCGTPLQVCGPAGCIEAFRQDGCPGCTAYVIDLSEAGIAGVCGVDASVCSATVTRLVEYLPE
jgi:hypothetical protein